MAVDGRSTLRIVPLVAPVSNDPNTSGKVRNLSCGGGVCHRQLVRQDDGSYELQPSWHRKGWRLLRDMYEEEGDHEGWLFYVKYLDAWQGGRTLKSFPKSRLPKSVQERQRCMLPDEFAEEFASPPTTGAVVAEPQPAPEVKPERKPRPEVKS